MTSNSRFLPASRVFHSFLGTFGKGGTGRAGLGSNLQGRAGLRHQGRNRSQNPISDLGSLLVEFSDFSSHANDHCRNRIILFQMVFVVLFRLTGRHIVYNITLPARSDALGATWFAQTNFPGNETVFPIIF